MFRLIRGCRAVFVGMTIWAFLTALPVEYAIAAIIDTQASQWEENPGNLRAQVLTLLAREDVRLAFLQHGVNPAEVEARVAAMTDDEIASMAKTVNDMPAGGFANTWGGLALAILGVAVIGTLVILLLIGLGIWGGFKVYNKYNEQKESTPATVGQDQPTSGQPSPVVPTK